MMFQVHHHNSHRVTWWSTVQGKFYIFLGRGGSMEVVSLSVILWCRMALGHVGDGLVLAARAHASGFQGVMLLRLGWGKSTWCQIGRWSLVIPHVSIPLTSSMLPNCPQTCLSQFSVPKQTWISVIFILKCIGTKIFLCNPFFITAIVHLKLWMHNLLQTITIGQKYTF